MPRYLIIVARDEPALCEHLARQHAGDSGVRVVGDRRCREAAVAVERRQQDAREARPAFGHLCWIVEASFEEPSPERAPARPELERRGSMEALEDRQRVDRWIEESQYLIGRLIPGLLDDHDRLKGKLEAAEQECERLRHEAAELRKEMSDLQSETQYFRTEHVAMADALREVIEHVGQIHKPLNDVHRRLQVTQPALSATAWDPRRGPSCRSGGLPSKPPRAAQTGRGGSAGWDGAWRARSSQRRNSFGMSGGFGMTAAAPSRRAPPPSSARGGRRG